MAMMVMSPMQFESPTHSPSEMPPQSPAAPVSNVNHAVKLAMRFFLEQKHYRQLLRILANQWGGCHSLTAAVELMKSHKIKVTPEDEQRLAKLPEERMIEALVQRMPQGMDSTKEREAFEHFFLQLSFIASTTTRMRTALENGLPEAVDESLESAENVGVLGYMLKMAISQAGKEVESRRNHHEQWLADTDAKMSPLLSTSAESMQVQKNLAQAKATIECYSADAREKSRHVLMALTDGNEKTLLANSFLGWADHVKKIARENDIRKEYEEQIVEANKKLYEYQQAKLANVKTVLERNIKLQGENLLATCFAAFKVDWEKSNTNKESETQQKALQGKIDEFAARAAENAKQVMVRMVAGTDGTLQALCLTAWKQALEEEKKEKEMEEVLKVTQKRVEEFMKTQKSGAKQVLSHMTNQSNSAMLQTFFQHWCDVLKEAKAAAEAAAKLNVKASQLAALTERSKMGSYTAAERLADLMDEQILVFCLCFWKRDTKIERIRRLGKEKNDKHKKHLVGVKGLFKNFATDLDTHLQSGTPRVDAARAAPRKLSP